jgi:hypothetical protein
MDLKEKVINRKNWVDAAQDNIIFLSFHTFMFCSYINIAT